MNKYEELAWQIKEIWKQERVSIYPLVITVERVVSYNFNKNIEKLGQPYTILKHAQKTTIIYYKLATSCASFSKEDHVGERKFSFHMVRNNLFRTMWIYPNDQKINTI